MGTPRVIQATEPRTVRVGTYDNRPKIYQDAEGKTLGVYADILNYIAEKENWNIEYVYGVWDEELARLEKGEIDIMVDVAVSKEREQLFDFTTETVMNSWGEVYVQEGTSIDSILDLEGKKISILQSSVYGGGEEGIEDYLKAFGLNATIIETDENVEVLYLVENGMADAGIVSHIFGLTHQNDYHNLKSTSIFLKPTELRFALTKGDGDNPYLIERLDYWVVKLKNGYENYYNQSLERYGLSELRPQAKQQLEEELVLPCWALPAALASTVAFLLSGLIAILFRQFKKKAAKSLKDKNIALIGSERKSREIGNKSLRKSN